jgi:hypothetical protein
MMIRDPTRHRTVSQQDSTLPLLIINQDSARKLVPAKGSCARHSINVNPRIQSKLNRSTGTLSTNSVEKPDGVDAEVVLEK